MSWGAESKLGLYLTGPFTCRFDDGLVVDVRAAKQRALIAMLALAPGHRHTRSWLRETLWSRVDKEQGADSLRQCLAGLRRTFGDRFQQVFQVGRQEVGLHADRIHIHYDLNEGPFLEGLEWTDTPMRLWYDRALQSLDMRIRSNDMARFGNLRPRITVVPFLARNNSEDDRHLSDLVAQEVLRILSRNRGFDVISHFSSRRYAGTQLDLVSLGDQLATDYLATGTIASRNGRFRLDVDFIEVSSGRIVWTDALEDAVKGLLEDGSTVMAGIAHRIGAGILKTSVELTRAQPMPEVQSHALFMAALSLMHQHRLKTFSKARHLLEHLTERHRDRAPLHAWLGMWYLLRLSQGLGSGGAEDVMKARSETGRALDIDPTCPVSLTIDGMARSHNASGFDAASSRFEDAVDVDPNNALAFLMHSRLRSFTGDGAEAVRLAERARELSPCDPQEYFFEGLRATAYLVAGDFSKARSIVERSIKINPRHTSSLRGLTIIAQLMGDDKTAHQTLGKLRACEPNLTVSSYLRAHPAGELAIGRQWAKALSDAGLPD